MIKRQNKNKNIRVDAYDKVTAKAQYIEDMDFSGLLHGAVIRSSITHGKVNGISNIEEIENMPGVKAVVTAVDVPGENIVPFVKNDYPCLADKEVKFAGQAIALVAADTVEEARDAADTAHVDYEEYPGVYDPIEALVPNSVYVGGDDNIHSSYKIRKGNVDRGFKDCLEIVEAVYNTKHQVHCYLENQGMTAVPQTNGTIEIYGSMQCPFYIHNAMVKITGLKYNMIRVVQATTGGGFGGKEDVASIVAAHAALLALKTDRPVRIICDRKEDFISMSKRHPARVRLKYGADANGNILACEGEYIVNGGAFSTLSPIVAWRGIIHMPGCYEIPNVKLDSYAVATNTVPCGAFRGFGMPQVAVANECLIDELAEKLNMDPLDLRKKNMLKTGKETATGQIIGDSCGMEETLDQALSKVKYVRHKGTSPGKIKKGIGMSTTFYGVGLGAEGKYFAKAGAEVHVKEDGSILVAIGNVEMGQGAETVFNRICADTTGCPYDLVHIMKPDTTRVPDSGPTVASRATMIGGKAVMDASLQIQNTFKKVVAEKMKVRPFDVTVEDNTYKTINGEMGYIDVVKEAYYRREKVAVQGWYKVEGTSFDEKTGLGDPYVVYTFSTNICEVEVDTETGRVKVKKIVAAHDVGKAIHVQSAEGQIQGGTVQAIGYTLYENLCLDRGKILNPSFTGYILPTSMDVCDVIPVLVEFPYKDGPFGAKGLGEPPMVGPPAAILNAIYDAVGVRMRNIPCLPEDILRELENNLNRV